MTTLAIAVALSAHGLAAEPRPHTIFGGTPTETCEWPTVVRVGECSGVLVHPEIVITAGHCQDVTEIVFGVDEASAERVPTVECEDAGEYEPGEGLDLGWCRLAEPRDDLVVVPPLMGDEADVLQRGRAVRIVGFGLTENGDFGVQHVVATTLGSIDGTYAFLGGDGRDSCLGDSGAPAFVELADGTLRVFALTSYGPVPCGAGGFYTLVAAGMPWLEASTGVDLTPCHDAEGGWAPDERCTTAPAVQICESNDDDDASTGCALGPRPSASMTLVIFAALSGLRRRALSRPSGPRPARAHRRSSPP